MEQKSTPVVVNAHWFGGSDKLPPNTVYVGRPGIWGNAYSSQSGKYTREECVALHRVDLYRSLIEDRHHFSQLKHDLQGHDLACWCKQPKRIVGCHGDNYLHVLNDRHNDRLYNKSIIHYLMEDLRSVMTSFDTWIGLEPSQSDYLDLLIGFGDVRVYVQYALLVYKEKQVEIEDLCFFIATIVVDLELARQDTNKIMIDYRFRHVYWLVDRFIKNRIDRFEEPIPPDIPLQKPSGRKLAKKILVI